MSKKRVKAAPMGTRVWLRFIALAVASTLSCGAFAWDGGVSPQDNLGPDAWLTFETAARKAFDLLAYVQSVADTIPSPESQGYPAYNRRWHFGTWRHPDPSSCLNTRAAVLVREDDPSVPVQYKDQRHCMVIGGLWHDPYTASDFNVSHDVEIDHVVPLKAAYVAGAYTWAPEHRCQYANYVGNNFHLRAVSGRQNEIKSNHGPERYLPPNHAFRCQYVNDWMKIKAIWELGTTSAEVHAIEQVLSEEHCPVETQVMPSSELRAQRLASAQTIPGCVGFGGDASN
jgi:hypothetical protein